jgi:predicted molibdopterin-dependent oxidoreductase YjgC
MGTLPKFLPGYQSVTDAQARAKFEERWGASLPAEAGLTTLEIMEQAKKRSIKGMYIVGENPVLSFPNSRLITEILTSLDFLVVQDMFLTETARLANVVLPAASFAEKEGTFTNFEGRVNRVRKAIEPIGESLPDWEIVMRLADKMDYPLPFSSLQDVMTEIEELVPSYEAYTDSERQDELAYGETGRTYGRQLLEGFARFSPIECTPQARERKSDYPFTLLTGIIFNHFGTGSRSSRSLRLKRFSPEAFVEICESDARKLAITDGEKVKVISAVGEVTTMVKITDTLGKGMLFMPVSFPETPVNELFDIVLDPETKAPSLKACSVKIEKNSLPGGEKL